MFDMPKRPPITRFVKDRIKETSYKDEEYIAALMQAEGFFDGHAVRGFAANMAKGTLKRSYPVECECIAREQQEGIYTSPLEFHDLKARADAARRQEVEAQRRLRKDEEWRHYEWWLEQGGKP